MLRYHYKQSGGLDTYIKCQVSHFIQGRIIVNKNARLNYARARLNWLFAKRLNQTGIDRIITELKIESVIKEYKLAKHDLRGLYNVVS